MARSRAWQVFVAARRELNHLIQVARYQSHRLEPNRVLSDQENQLRLVVVALVGQFQAYISDLMDELCDNLPDKWDQLAPFQKRYVTVQLRRRLETVLEDYSESDLVEERKLDQFKRAFSTCSEWPQRPSALAASSHRQELYGFLTDNSTKSIDRSISQFRPDGMKFSDWLYKHHPSYRGVFDVLDNAIRLRNEAAHGQIGQRVTLRDARTYRATLYRLIQKADEYAEATAAATVASSGPQEGDDATAELASTPMEASTAPAAVGSVTLNAVVDGGT